MRKSAFLLLIIVFARIDVDAQSLLVGSVENNYYRNAQLLGKADSTISFTLRPLILTSILSYENELSTDTTQDGYIRTKKVNDLTYGKFNGRFLPLDWQTRFNSSHPYGWNDGALIPARGLQTLISGGYYANYGPISIQLKPEVIFAENPDFKGFTSAFGEVLWWTLYYDFYNYTDLPERFGEKSYSRAFWGQSNIRFNFHSLSFGISTENLWWGPGIRNSLLMSNSAPGFKHLTFNTSRPVGTSIGSFEWQLIAGRLEGSGFSTFTPDRLYFGGLLDLPKPSDWRYLSGLALSWQPKWVSGLFLGLTRSSQIYSKDLKNIGGYLPLFSLFQKVNADEPINRPDRLSSLFLRWVWPSENAEVYFEYGRSSPSGNLRDFALEPENARAYIFGFRKLLSYKGRPDENIQVSLEVTQLQQTAVSAVRNAEAWYVNKYIRHGYTNRGEQVGAGIGPGANLQSLEISWVKGLKRIGLQFERYVHNNDYYYYAFEPSLDWRRHWVDLSIKAGSEWDHKNFIFNVHLNAIHSYNYKWNLIQDIGDPYVINGIDAFNMQAQIGLTYRF